MADTETKDNPDRDLVARVRRRFDVMSRADQENRDKARDDLKFVHVPGEQWEAWAKRERGERPCYEFNKTRVTIKRVVNDIRANRPQGKVRAVEDGDKDTAEVMGGLCRNIWNTSDGDTIFDGAAEYQVACGMGAWRVNTKYSSDTAFDQDIVIEAIPNPLCLYSDPAAQDLLKRDAEDWILTEKVTKKAFAARWPKAEPVEFEGSEFDDSDADWEDDERVRVAEYWWKEPVEKEIWLLSDGTTLDSSEVDPDLGRPVKESDLTPAGITILKRRTVKCHKVMMAIVSGDAVLEGPTEWAGKEFPFVQIYGEYVVIDGKTHWFGLTRFAKDAQRLYNAARTAISETIALAPQAKYWATAKQAAGHEQEWAEAHKKNYPFITYTVDGAAPGPPPRVGGADVPVALIQESQLASDEIKAVTGIFDASLGNRSNEQSGVAIRSRQAQGEVATFNYRDNAAKGIQRTWEILLDLAPKVYDTERNVRILGVDGAEKYAKLNSVDANGNTLNDITRGKFDATVTVGPSFATQRMEAAEIYGQMAQANPALFGVAGDLMMKAADLPYSDQIAERLKVMLPPQIAQAEGEGKPMPPEVQAAMAQADQMVQQVQAMGAAVQEASQQVKAEKADADKAKSEVQIAVANLKVQEANLDKQVAEFKALVAETEARLTAERQQGEAATQQQAGAERESMLQEVAQALALINEQSQAFQQAAAQVLSDVQQVVASQAQAAQRPKNRQFSAKRVNGQLVGTLIDPETGKETRIETQRVNGELIGRVFDADGAIN